MPFLFLVLINLTSRTNIKGFHQISDYRLLTKQDPLLGQQ